MVQNRNMHLFGFNSIRDFVQVTTGAKYKLLALADFACALVVSLSLGIVEGVEHWIWSPFYTLVIYFAVLGADFLSGVAVGIKVRKEGFITQKGQRLFIIFIVHFVLLGVMFNLGRINTDLGVEEIPAKMFDVVARTFYMYVLGINIISFARNCSALGIIKGSIADFLVKNIDPHKSQSEITKDESK